MKTLIFSIALSSLVIASCNNASRDSATQGTKDKDTIATVGAAPANSSSIQAILDPYFEVKNALTQDDAKTAAEAAQNLVKALKAFDQSSLKEEQKKIYTDVYDDAQEHAEHISSNAANIKHQREHFETLSDEVYELAKSAGGTQKLYYTNCPMYNNNKGANWLSETKEVKNPYLGMA
ncbi:DUF3347 domain-containing protein, partial [Daejeonella sp.]|uniref:DUF3347 domain-containing protein n=1 Tax=Daejeonella sp. TaxID=2805397 RepID=UPI0030BC6B0C